MPRCFISAPFATVKRLTTSTEEAISADRGNDAVLAQALRSPSTAAPERATSACHAANARLVRKICGRVACAAYTLRYRCRRIWPANHA